MKEKVGEVFSIAKDNRPVPGCTVSREIQGGSVPISYFALAPHTDISAEIYPYHKMILVAEGSAEVYTPVASIGKSGQDVSATNDIKSDNSEEKTVKHAYSSPETIRKEMVHQVSAGEGILTPIGIPVGIRTSEGAVYTEFGNFAGQEKGKRMVRSDEQDWNKTRRKYTMNEAVKAGEVFKLADLVPYQEGKIINMDVIHNDQMKFVVMAFDKGTGLAEHAAPGEAIIFALDGEGIIGYEGKEHPIKAGENFHFAKGGLHYVKAEKPFKMALLLTLA